MLVDLLVVFRAAIRAASFFTVFAFTVFAARPFSQDCARLSKAVRVIEFDAVKVKRAGRRDGGVPAQVRTVRELRTANCF
ncbi:hypothetical protein, partial [Paraburkholderia caledonica]|uniref:hypothetical protein n=1 Tax=Paraburkholderia caledonica TaxID=134536 RepID=UPI003C888555